MYATGGVSRTLNRYCMQIGNCCKYVKFGNQKEKKSKGGGGTVLPPSLWVEGADSPRWMLLPTFPHYTVTR